MNLFIKIYLFLTTPVGIDTGYKEEYENRKIQWKNRKITRPTERKL